MFIRPVRDPDPDAKRGARLAIRDPDTMELLPPEGAEKPETEYWQRRLLQDGSVEIVEPKAHTPDPKAPEPTATLTKRSTEETRP